MSDEPVPRRAAVVDVTRLVSRLKRGAPTGIDRVDLAYARHYLRGDVPGVVSTPWGTRLMPPSRVGTLLAELEAVWREAPGSLDREPAFQRVRTWLAGGGAENPAAPAPASAGRARLLPARHALRFPARAARALPWAGADKVPANAVYLHTSHLGLDKPSTLAWLDARPDVKPVFFIHDLIPIDFPEYGKPGEAARHRARMTHVGQRAAGILVNSAAVGERVREFLRAEGLPDRPVAVAPLGVEDSFKADVAPVPAARPFFVVLSTIEARKNHLLVLQVWRELARELGPGTPALVVVGRRGWEAEGAIDLLDRCEAIRPHVLEASGLSTPAVASLLAGARALLMPSFAEGYGIPIVEALALGTPVLASDLPVHREVAGGRATFLHPLDGPGWADAVKRLAAMPDGPGRDGGYRPPGWPGHFAVADRFLGTL